LHEEANNPQESSHWEKAGITAANRIAELRLVYSHNPIALQQLDVYDQYSPYHIKFREYLTALKAGDLGKMTELEGWFEEHYPNIKPS